MKVEVEVEEGEEESGRGTFEVRSTRLTGVDQISEGEIIQGRRRRDRDKAPSSWLTISERGSFLFLFLFPLVLSSRPAPHPSLERPH